MLYTRTNKGTAAATNMRILLPRRMRAILVSINSWTNPIREVQGCSTSETQSLLDELCQLGYVVTDIKTEFSDSKTTTVAQPAQAQYLPEADVKSAISLMNDFIMIHLPNEALQILFALEKLDRIELLHQALPAYASQITRLGAPAAIHLKDLHRLLGLSFTSPQLN